MKFLKEYYKQILYTVSLIIVLSVLVPLFLEHFVYRNEVYSTISNSEVASFLGNFLGALIGGGITLVTMYVSISETRKDLRREERIKDRSYIDIFAKKSESGTLRESKDYYKRAKVIIDNNYAMLLAKPAVIAKNNGLNFMGIKNCGPAIIREVRVDIINENGRKKAFFVNRILIEELFFIPIVYEKSEDMNCYIKGITVIYKTLSDETVVINKIFDKNLRYSEKFEVYEKYKYEYNSQMCGWMDIENLN